MTKSKIGQVVSYIAILLVIVAAIGVFSYFTNGFTTDFKTFYVSVNGKDVMTSQNGYVVTPSEPLKVDVKYTFAFNKNETKGYSVKIVPNKTDEDFDSSVDGERPYKRFCNRQAGTIFHSRSQRRNTARNTQSGLSRK